MTFNFEHVGFPNNTGKNETVSGKWEGCSSVNVRGSWIHQPVLSLLDIKSNVNGLISMRDYGMSDVMISIPERFSFMLTAWTYVALL